jgi:DNA polymerase-3 subunit alpha
MCRIEPLVERVRALRLGAIGIADLHSAYGFVPFYVTARAAGLRPLLGVTVRLQADVEAQASWGDTPAFLQLLARDAQGLRNLLRLLSQAEFERAGGPAAVGFQDLERFATGLMALDGGRRGPIAQSLVRGASAGADAVAGRLREIFGADGFAIELQRLGAAEDAVVEPFIVHLARRINAPLVATTDVRYLDASDADAYAVLRCIRSGEPCLPSGELGFAPEAHVLRSDPEMRQLYRDLPEALENTHWVAERCQVELDLENAASFEFGTASGRNPAEELHRDSERGACQRYGARSLSDLPVAVRTRLAHELAVIGEMELASCFLIARDVVRHAKEEGISVGPGHGTAAGSLVCFALGITSIDPLRHGLLFERFLSRGTGRWPHFEFDVAHRRRDDLVQYVLRRLGPERVAQAASWTTLSTRSVVREVAHALGFESSRIESLARSLHADGAMDLWQALDRSPELKRAYQEDASVRRLLDVARRLEGLPRNPTLHAGGLLVAPGRITDCVALQRTRSGDVVAQVTPEGAQALGLLRLDLVASRAMTVIRDGMQLVAQRKGIALALETLPLEDEPTFRLLGQGETHGVAYLDGPSVQGLLRAVQPENFDEIVAVLCLCRPGTRATALFDRKPEMPPDVAGVLMDARLRPILAATHGLLLYQEQLMEIAVALAGFDLEDAENLRQALQRRRIGDLARDRARFVRGAVENGMVVDDAEALFGSLLRFANFDFDKVHGTGSAYLAYACAYLRANHPEEFAVALLRDAAAQPLRLREALADTIGRGIPIVPVDVNRSARDFSATADGVRIGLAQVRRLGDVGAERVVDERRRHGVFASFADFCRRLPEISRPAIEGLVKAGGFESLGLSRPQALAVLGSVLEAIDRERRQDAAGAQLELGFERTPARAAMVIPETADASDAELATWEREALDFSVRDDRLLREVALRGRCDLAVSRRIADLGEGAVVRAGGSLRRVTETQTRRGERMAFLRLEDQAGELDIVVFPRTMDQLDPRWFEVDAAGMWILVEGKVEHQREASRVVADRLEVVSRTSRTTLPLPGLAAARPAATDSAREPGESSPSPNAERPASSPGVPAARDAAANGWLFRVEAPKPARPSSRRGTRQRNAS